MKNTDTLAYPDVNIKIEKMEDVIMLPAEKLRGGAKIYILTPPQMV